MIHKKIVSTKMVTNFRWFLFVTDQIRKKIILKSFARQSEILKLKKLSPNLLLKKKVSKCFNKDTLAKPEIQGKIRTILEKTILTTEKIVKEDWEMQWLNF